jgi:hypothetical protein
MDSVVHLLTRLEAEWPDDVTSPIIIMIIIMIIIITTIIIINIIIIITLTAYRVDLGESGGALDDVEVVHQVLGNLTIGAEHRQSLRRVHVVIHAQLTGGLLPSDIIIVIIIMIMIIIMIIIIIRPTHDRASMMTMMMMLILMRMTTTTMMMMMMTMMMMTTGRTLAMRR